MRGGPGGGRRAVWQYGGSRRTARTEGGTLERASADAAERQSGDSARLLRSCRHAVCRRRKSNNGMMPCLVAVRQYSQSTSSEAEVA